MALWRKLTTLAFPIAVGYILVCASTEGVDIDYRSEINQHISHVSPDHTSLPAQIRELRHSPTLSEESTALPDGGELSSGTKTRATGLREQNDLAAALREIERLKTENQRLRRGLIPAHDIYPLPGQPL